MGGKRAATDDGKLLSKGRQQCPLICVYMAIESFAAALTQVLSLSLSLSLSMSVRADVIEDGHHPGVV
jgi:hypothetical protein